MSRPNIPYSQRHGEYFKTTVQMDMVVSGKYERNMGLRGLGKKLDEITANRDAELKKENPDLALVNRQNRIIEQLQNTLANVR